MQSSASLPGLFRDLVEKRDQRELARRLPFARSRTLQALKRVSWIVFHRLNQRRMDVCLAAYRNRIAERFGDWFDHRPDADPRVSGLVEHLLKRENGRAPSTEM